jgi:triosephosphate isomerase
VRHWTAAAELLRNAAEAFAENDMRQLIAGNWKMNGLGAALGEIAALGRALKDSSPACDVLVCPPATLIARARALNSGIAIGGQDCHAQPSGAFTGDISAEMLKDAGASAVIVGHSERRHYHGETDEDVAAKARAAWRAGLLAIICIGETEVERDAGHAHDVCKRQLAGSIPAGAAPENTVVAYEPIWAIGTGKTATSQDILQMHAHIRACLGVPSRILYGGSVKPSNAAEILALDEVGGALVGGASLKAAEFLTIVKACRASS